MKGVILSAGHGTRLWPITHTQAKQLIPIANKPMVFYVIEDLRNAGIKDIAVIVGHTPERINHVKGVIGDGSRWGIKITYVEQAAPSGIAQAVGLTKDFVGNDDFIVYLGDNVLKGGINDYVDAFKKSGADFGILLSKHKSPEMFGVAVFDKDDKLVGFVEKPKDPPSNLVITGIYMLRPCVFHEIEKLLKGPPGVRGEYQITDVFDTMMKSGKYRPMTCVVKDWWKDTGKPEDILEANHLLLEELKPVIRGTVKDGAKITGKVEIGEGSVIEPGSFIRGPVIIGKDCKVGPNAYIGPYTAVGDGCEISESEVESSILLTGVKINCNRRIVDSIIGANSKILSRDGQAPRGSKLVAGENSQIYF